MSGVKRYIPEGYTQPASRSGTGTHMVESRDGDYVLASDYDALAQRCRELDIEASRLSGWLGACDRERLATQQERDALRAEVEQLRQQAALTQQPDTGHELFAELYQILGELGASEAVLDQVLAASQGDPLPHASLLPYAAGQPDTVAVPRELLREALAWLEVNDAGYPTKELRSLLGKEDEA